jgi:hypothetical protein
MFTYITSVRGKSLTKSITAKNYQTALTKFEQWATKNCKAFAILGETEL